MAEALESAVGTIAGQRPVGHENRQGSHHDSVTNARDVKERKVNDEDDVEHDAQGVGAVEDGSEGSDADEWACLSLSPSGWASVWDSSRIY